MKKLMMMALLGLTMMGGMKVLAQDATEQKDSAQLAEEPKDTISIDNMEPTFYEDEATKESSNTMTYAIIGGIVVVGGVGFYVIRKKKK
jgi:LPXTG-motif cell wall-anchored protein